MGVFEAQRHYKSHKSAVKSVHDTQFKGPLEFVWVRIGFSEIMYVLGTTYNLSGEILTRGPVHRSFTTSTLKPDESKKGVSVTVSFTDIWVY